MFQRVTTAVRPAEKVDGGTRHGPLGAQSVVPCLDVVVQARGAANAG
jgi:hypothetical protein